MSIDDTYSPFDIIIALPHHVVAYMVQNHIHELPRPWLYFPPIPPQIRRVWVYEDEPIDGITVMIRVDRDTLPTHLYGLRNPLYVENMEANYNYLRGQIPGLAPVQILRRFRSQHLLQIW
jgi:hypothetical protein